MFDFEITLFFLMKNTNFKHGFINFNSFVLKEVFDFVKKIRTNIDE